MNNNLDLTIENAKEETNVLEDAVTIDRTFISNGSGVLSILMCFDFLNLKHL